MEAVDFWTSNQPGFKFARARPGTPEFFAEVQRHRYALEPHIRHIARFEHWTGKDVLDVGCGLATDGAEFARNGARYVGIDASPTAVELATRRFELENLEGSVIEGSATHLPFEDNTFDLVWSHGVIHHIEETEAAAAEFHRVLRHGGLAIVMLYHRHSFNYAFTIMGIRRMLAALLLVPGGVTAASKLTSEDKHVLNAHRQLLRTHGLRYLTDTQFFLSNNTDGPGNRLSKVYSRDEAAALFRQFRLVRTTVRYLNARLYPGGRRLERTSFGRALGRRAGWHLYVHAVK
jgi:SAM-dependent methyltransferase